MLLHKMLCKNFESCMGPSCFGALGKCIVCLNVIRLALVVVVVNILPCRNKAQSKQVVVYTVSIELKYYKA